MYVRAVMICQGKMTDIISECAINQKTGGVFAIREMAVAMKIDFHEVWLLNGRVLYFFDNFYAL